MARALSFVRGAKLTYFPFEVQPDSVQAVEDGGLVMYLIGTVRLGESDLEFGLAEVALLAGRDDLQPLPFVIERQIRDAEGTRGRGMPGLDEKFTAAQDMGGIARAQQLFDLVRPFPVAEEAVAAALEGFARTARAGLV